MSYQQQPPQQQPQPPHNNMMSLAGQKRPAAQRSNPGPSRSVNDYETEEQLRRALMEVDVSLDDDCTPIMLEIAEGQPVQKVARIGEKSGNNVIQALDWVLPNFDPSTTEPQNMQEEMTRLQVLRSYVILDAEREQAFERITSLASRIFDVPIALVSIVDLGRQWFMSNYGLGDVRETPRKLAFCSHAILNKENMLVVPDARLDFRFVDSPLVKGPPHIRFYAGAPLISPEGYKLGTFCIIDSEPRPNGLSQEQRDTLRDLADMTVKVMVDRRYQMEKKNEEDPAQLIAYTAHDLMTPLTGLQLSLSLLKEDEEVRAALGEHHLELLNTAMSCSDLMVRICQNSMLTLRESESVSNPVDNSLMLEPTPIRGSNVTETRLSDLAKGLYMIMEPIANKVPLIITVDEAAPPVILADDLKLFRSALNLMTNAVHRTSVGMVRLSIHPVEDTLVFECEDTGADIPVEEYEYMFQPCQSEDGDLRVSLSSIASLINSMEGEYGFRPRGIAADGTIVNDSKGRRRSGSVFWFSIPLAVPATSGSASGTMASDFVQQLGESTGMIRSGSSNNVANKKTSVVVGDIFQADAIQGSCLAAAFEPSMMMTDKSEQSVPSYEMANTSINDDCKIPAQSKTNGAAPSPLNGRRMRRALVIDDSLVIRKSIERALSKLGFDVALAVDGMEGLNKMKETMFDMVLCDFLMPVMDGMDCVKQYRDWEAQNRAWFRQYIIGISAHANVNDSGQGIRAGMNEFKPKPVTIATLTELQQSEEVVSRTNQLDELEGGASRASMVDDGDILPLESRSILDTGMEGVSAELVCLIATDSPTLQPNQLPPELQSLGWKVVVVNDGTDCMRLLQMRNWDVVLIDDDLPKLPGVSCIASFRDWEGKNRVNLQKNVFLVCEGEIPSPLDKRSMVQPPEGCDGVLGRPVPWTDLQQLLQTNNGDRGMDIVVR